MYRWISGKELVGTRDQIFNLRVIMEIVNGASVPLQAYSETRHYQALRIMPENFSHYVK